MNNKLETRIFQAAAIIGLAGGLYWASNQETRKEEPMQEVKRIESPLIIDGGDYFQIYQIREPTVGGMYFSPSEACALFSSSDLTVSTIGRSLVEFEGLIDKQKFELQSGGESNSPVLELRYEDGPYPPRGHRKQIERVIFYNPRDDVYCNGR